MISLPAMISIGKLRDNNAVFAHLKVLEGSGLVRSKKVGRVRTYELAPGQLQIAEDWLGRQRSVWECRLDRLDAHLLSMKKERSE